MPRLLILGSALTVLTSACFRSPATAEAAGTNLCLAAGGQCVTGAGCPGISPTTAQTNACAPSGTPAPAGYACCLPCLEGESPNAGSGRGCFAGGTGTTSGSSSSGSTGGSSGQCELPEPGSCSTDGDCVVAECGDDLCSCGGWVIARSQLGQNPCLVEDGALVPTGCAPHGIPCDCPAHPGCTPRCESGTCACEATCATGATLCNGQCVITSGNLDNCGTCGHACGSGQTCVNGSCSSNGTGTSTIEDDAGLCSAGDFCACTNFCVSTCRCVDGGCPPTPGCEGALCPNPCPSGEACSSQPGGVFRCSPLCTPGGGSDGQGSCQAGMICQTVCT